MIRPSLARFEVAQFLNRPHPARPDGEDDGELAANFTLPVPVFLRSAEGGSQKNRQPKQRASLASHQIHHPGEPDGVFSQLPRIHEEMGHDNSRALGIELCMNTTTPTMSSSNRRLDLAEQRVEVHQHVTVRLEEPVKVRTATGESVGGG